MKTCTKCNTKKSLTEFPVDKRMLDGRHSHCKQCRNKTYSDYEKSKKGTERHKRYDRSEKGKARAIKHDRTDKRKKTHERYRLNNKKKIFAARIVRNEVRYQRIAQPSELLCKSCGQQAAHYHHYMGYEDQYVLHIIPLCKLCHAMMHV